uniref:BHLH domain-containing protein n=1 Tax=Oryza punctata TaxID=4537 RepID=A0A0E0KB66_ORYPU
MRRRRRVPRGRSFPAGAAAGVGDLFRPHAAAAATGTRWELPNAVFMQGAGAAEAKKGGAAGSGDDGRHRHHHNYVVQSAASRERWRRISNKTAELSRLIPGTARMNSTTEMLQAAARPIRLLANPSFPHSRRRRGGHHGRGLSLR